MAAALTFKVHVAGYSFCIVAKHVRRGYSAAEQPAVPDQDSISDVLVGTQQSGQHEQPWIQLETFVPTLGEIALENTIIKEFISKPDNGWRLESEPC